MLRRQINNEEYVAISATELKQIVADNNQQVLQQLRFVIPTLHMVRGYYETQMKIVDLGRIKNISGAPSYNVSFEQHNTVHLKATNHFVRWLGL